MENLDLNIDNYDLNDILKLFRLNHNFGENELKQAKRIVMQTHPDKSGLESKFFIFFGKAYKTLHYIYNFKRKNNTETLFSYDELLSHTENENNVIDKIKNNKDFNKIFNKIFDDVKIKNEFCEKGYGDWLQDSNEDFCENKVYTKQEMHKFINKKRSEMIKNSKNDSSTINTLSVNSHYNLTQNAPQSYESGLFSNLKYDDVKIAYTESIIPVDETKTNNYKSLEQLKQIRSKQNIDPLSKKQSNEILNNQERSENLINMNRAFLLAKQNEQAELAQKKIMSKFYTLTN